MAKNKVAPFFPDTVQNTKRLTTTRPSQKTWALSQPGGCYRQHHAITSLYQTYSASNPMLILPSNGSVTSDIKIVSRDEGPNNKSNFPAVALRRLMPSLVVSPAPVRHCPVLHVSPSPGYLVRTVINFQRKCHGLLSFIGSSFYRAQARENPLCFSRGTVCYSLSFSLSRSCLLAGARDYNK